jgi:hypothetical protein
MENGNHTHEDPQEDPQESKKYPSGFIFPTCPVCGGTSTIAKELAQEDIDTGKIPAGVELALVQTILPLVGPAAANGLVIQGVKPITVIVALCDVCATCGTMYCIKAEKGKGGVQSQPQGGQNRPIHRGLN